MTTMTSSRHLGQPDLAPPSSHRSPRVRNDASQKRQVLDIHPLGAASKRSNTLSGWFVVCLYAFERAASRASASAFVAFEPILSSNSRSQIHRGLGPTSHSLKAACLWRRSRHPQPPQPSVREPQARNKRDFPLRRILTRRGCDLHMLLSCMCFELERPACESFVPFAQLEELA